MSILLGRMGGEDSDLLIRMSMCNICDQLFSCPPKSIAAAAAGMPGGPHWCFFCDQKTFMNRFHCLNGACARCLIVLASWMYALLVRIGRGWGWGVDSRLVLGWSDGMSTLSDCMGECPPGENGLSDVTSHSGSQLQGGSDATRGAEHPLRCDARLGPVS